MKIDEVKERLNQVVDEYKTADEKQRGELEKERKKLGKKLMQLSGIDHEEKVRETMHKKENMTYSDIYWLFSVGIGANFILSQIGLLGSHVDSVDFSTAKAFYQSQYQLRVLKE
ncbi:MAG: hypothetical protein ACFWT6_12080 [Virgibacillus proomii]|jgi:hypothetical protein